MITQETLNSIRNRSDFINYLKKNTENNPIYQSALEKFDYEQELLTLQAELVDFQRWVQKENKKIAILFEGRDASGKGGTIKRFTEHLNPRAMRIVALNKPTEVEKNQWYFNRYIKVLPNAGEIVFFDRSWYNRAVVEPVMGFCDKKQYDRFMIQVPEFENMLYESGATIIKFWFSVSKEEQQRRFEKRVNNPLKKWKFSPVDQKGQELWNEFTIHKNQMFSRTHNSLSPWVIVKSNNKKLARLESIKYVLSLFDYDNKGSSCKTLLPDPNVVQRYFRNTVQIDQ